MRTILFVLLAASTLSFAASAAAQRQPTDDEAAAITAVVAPEYAAFPASCARFAVWVSTVDPSYAIASPFGGPPASGKAPRPNPSSPCSAYYTSAYDILSNASGSWAVVYHSTVPPPCGAVISGPIAIDLVHRTLNMCWPQYVRTHLPTIPASTADAISCGLAQSPMGKRYQLYVPTGETASVCANARTAIFTWHGLPQRQTSPFGWVYVSAAKNHVAAPWTDVWVRNDEAVVVLAVLQP